MSSVVAENIKQEIRNFWYVIKIDGAKDPTGVENLSIIILFFNKHPLKAVKRLLVLSRSNSGDAKSITDAILADLTTAGTTSSKVLSQVYDGLFALSGHYGEVQRLLQERENRDFLCPLPNRQVHRCARNVDRTSDQSFFARCASLYNFFSSPQLHFTIMVKIYNAA